MSMKHFTLALIAALLVPVSLAGAQEAPEPFHFVALGDTTYAIPEDEPLYEALIGAINDTESAFSAHVGDTKGLGDCGREFQERQRAFFDSFSAPVFYAPGNNEWADCWKANRGSADPTEIMELLRGVFFAEASSMGERRMPAVRQADVDLDHASFAENMRWQGGGATFATLNMVGGHNNQELRVEKYWREFVAREAANVAWVGSAFTAAREAGHRAVVLFFHSNPFGEDLRYEGGPFEPVVERIIEEADAFDGQVLLVHGHHHELVIDRPVTEIDLDGPAVHHPNITRLQVYGWPDMKAVRVTVDVSKPWVFGFEPLWAAGRSVSPHSDID